MYFEYIHSEIIDDRIDAQFFTPEYIKSLKKINQFRIETLGNISRRIFDPPHTAPEFVDKSDFEMIMIENITLNGIEGNFRAISETCHKDIFKNSHLEGNELLVSRVGNSSGTFASVFPCYKGKNVSGNISIIKLKDEIIDKEYAFAYFNSNIGQNSIKRNIANTARKFLTISKIREFQVPIPSPEIQKYIGDKVRKAEELREEAKRLKKEAEEILNRELNLNKLEESLKSSINSKHNWITSMDINDRIDSYYYKRRYILVNQHLNDYECIQIRDIASVDYGYMPTEDYADENNGVPLIRVTNMIGNLLLDLSDLKYISKSINIPDDKYVDDGDILVVQCGNTTGKIALMTKEVENYLYPSFCLRIKLRNKSINNKYLALLMEMSIIQEQIWQSASYSSVRPNTTKPAIENIRIPLIEKQKQEDVGALVEKYIDNIYQSKQLILEAKQDVEDLIEGNFDMSKVRVNS